MIKGTFLYISASEIIIDEFSVSTYKSAKFIAFFTGAGVIVAMTFIEYD